MNQSFGFKKGSFVIRGPLVSVVIPAIAFIYQIYSLLSSPFGSLPENCEPHMAKVTCFSAVLNGKTKYRRIRQ